MSCKEIQLKMIVQLLNTMVSCTGSAVLDVTQNLQRIRKNIQRILAKMEQSLLEENKSTKQNQKE